MPYPEYLGYTKGEIDDLKSVVKDVGDVDLSGCVILKSASSNFV